MGERARGNLIPCLPLLGLALLGGCTPEKLSVPPSNPAPALTLALPSAPPSRAMPKNTSEQVRTACIAGRRLICGRVLKVLPTGLVVESGYTDLLRPPLTQSWVVPGTVSASRNSSLWERNEPGTPAVGLVFLTDISKRRKVNNFDYVILMGYPAGQYDYQPAPGVKKSIRKFAAGLDTAVRLTLQTTQANSPHS